MMTGINRLIHDLQEMEYKTISTLQGTDGFQYAVISGFEIPDGSFKGRIIDLAIPVPNDYPRSFGASIHLKADPHLVAFGSVPNVRNVIASCLGSEWQYWSYRFNLKENNPSSELITQINEIFRKN